MLFCGIDTSNYTTSAAVCDENGIILANLKRPLPVKDGERGLRQSDAVFAHVKNLPEIMQELGTYLDGSVTAVGVSSTPRTASDSYMPCFLCGVAAAEAFASGRNIPVFRFSHQQGHVMAAYSMSGADKYILKNDFIAFHVSGGTTELIRVSPSEDFKTDLLGGTADLNAGQAIDRTGVSLGLKFPCGPELEKFALEYKGKTAHRKVSVTGLECNLSGLENIVLKMKKDGADIPEIAAFVFDYIARTLEALAVNAREMAGNLPIVFAGGVMSNSIIKKRLSSLPEVYFTEPQYSADNAAGIALLCRKRYFENEFSAEEKRN